MAVLTSAGIYFRQCTEVPPDVVSSLKKMLFEKSTARRGAAVDILGHLGRTDAGAREALLDGLRSGPDILRSMILAEGIPEMGKAAKPLAEKIVEACRATDSDAVLWELVTSDCLDLLGKLGSTTPFVLDCIGSALSGSNEHVRSAAAVAIARLSTCRDTDRKTLESMLDSKECIERAAGACALSRLEGGTARDFGILMQSLGDADAKETASEALDSFAPADEAAAAVRNALAGARSKEIRLSLIRILGRGPALSADSVQSLLSALGGGAEDEKVAAIRALANSAGSRAEVRQRAIEGLKGVEGPDSSEEVRSAAADALEAVEGTSRSSTGGK
jgi:hypothetical protein